MSNFNRGYLFNYLCGCYHATQDSYGRSAPTYLPLLTSESHTSLISTSYRTTLKQFFHNPSDTDIKECIYTFPLYDGVALVSFKCHVGSRTLHGVVKEKNKAKEVYDEAVARGETAGLMEQLPEASDVFSTKLGNVPAGKTVVVEIEYVGELKQEAETNGVRFTIPTNIAPRYGSVTSGSAAPSARSSGIKIVVDAQMPAGSNIQGLQSPSHPIAIALGKISSETSDADLSLSKASATLSLDSTSLDKDFVLIVLAKDTGIPRAILEKHPTIVDQRALMVTLVPKFSLPPSRPEIVFVADRSGSMGGNIPILISAMKVFLKSLPVGVKFNICSFGSHHEFLWPKSKTYGQDTLKQAMSYVDRFDASFGGTETFSAIKATIEKRFTDVPLEVMLLTDGDIWQQDELFRYLNEKVDKSQGNIRVFPLGIGSGVSHALIEGVARAGNGFAQAVQDGEKLDNRVVRMLKGALSPHITDYTLEVKYKYEQSVGDDFELLEMFDKVTDGFKVSAKDTQEDEKPKQQKPISLFDSEVDPDAADTNTTSDKSGQDRYAHLPVITLPKLLQAPHKIPPLFPFTRTSVYLLMAPAHASHEPESVILRATSPQGPLELEIPVDVLSEPGETIHQLAVKKAVQDLEEGRGWIYEAKDEKDVSIKDRYPSRFDDMVEREAVRLGTQFGIAGKWCSFVAVADNDPEGDSDLLTGNTPGELQRPGVAHRYFEPHVLQDMAQQQPQQQAQQQTQQRNQMLMGCSFPQGAMGPQQQCHGQMSLVSQQQLCPTPMSLTRQQQSLVNRGAALSGPPVAYKRSRTRGFLGGSIGGGTSGNASPASVSASSPAFCMGMASPGQGGGSGEHRGGVNHFVRHSHHAMPPSLGQCSQVSMASPLASYAPPPPTKENKKRGVPYAQSKGEVSKSVDWTRASDEDKVHRLIALQDFEGFWEHVAELRGIMTLKGKDDKTQRALKGGEEDTVWTTILVVTFLEQKMQAEEGVWDLVVEKARAWLKAMRGEKEMETLEAEARAVFA